MNQQLQELALGGNQVSLTWDGFQWKCVCEIDHSTIKTQVQYFAVEPNAAVNMVYYLTNIANKKGVNAVIKHFETDEIPF